MRRVARTAKGPESKAESGPRDAFDAGVARALEAVEWRDGRLHFLTRSETVSGDEPAREMVQRYELTPADKDTLRVRLQIQRSHSVDAPLEFVAQRR